MSLPNNPVLPDLITRKEAAELCRCDVQTIDRWRKEGKLQDYPVRRKRLVSRNAVIRLIQPEELR